ncbi:MAG: hypothetical protein EB127_20900 [Alphaproteobacteria bacterium]|nr:hypothetical protein [Alphaproteobacteria bacterium]
MKKTYKIEIKMSCDGKDTWMFHLEYSNLKKARAEKRSLIKDWEYDINEVQIVKQTVTREVIE